MKFVFSTCLLLAVLGFYCATAAAPRYQYSYGVGGDAGVSYSGSREVGVKAKDGSYSLFTQGHNDPSIHGDAGVFVNPFNKDVGPGRG